MQHLPASNHSNEPLCLAFNAAQEAQKLFFPSLGITESALGSARSALHRQPRGICEMSLMTQRICPALATAALTGALVLTGCVSDFQFDLPEHHPAQRSSPSSGPLEVPNPFEVKPPTEASTEEEGGMHMRHGEDGMPSQEPTPEPMHEHGEHGGGAR